ncbi:MAG: serine hydrolase [Gemmataceae bacterium]
MTIGLRGWTVAVMLGSAVLGPVRAAEPLAESLEKLAAAHAGEVTYVVKLLGSDEVLRRKADQVMPTASLIKLAVLTEVHARFEAGTLDPKKTLTLTKDDKVPGAGVLTDHFSEGVTFPVRDAVRLMIVYSDNTATNMLIDQVSIPSVNARMKALGLVETRLNSKVYKRSTSSVDLKRSEQYGLGSTTANETLTLLELLHSRKLVSAKASEAMLTDLRANDDKEMLVRFLPPGTEVAHKTGAVSNARIDAGIIRIPTKENAKAFHHVAVCVMTNSNMDQSWVIDNAAQKMIARMGKAIYDHYAAVAKK